MNHQGTHIDPEVMSQVSREGESPWILNSPYKGNTLMSVDNKDYHETKDTFTQVSSSLMNAGLKPTPFRVMVCLISHAQGYQLSKPQIMKQCNIKRVALDNALKTLQKFNMIVYKPGYISDGKTKHSLFKVLHPSKWLPTGDEVKPPSYESKPSKQPSERFQQQKRKTINKQLYPLPKIVEKPKEVVTELSQIDNYSTGHEETPEEFLSFIKELEISAKH